MDNHEIAKIAERVSILMQLDRNRHHVATELDMKALANVPAYIASVFEEANAVGSALSPTEAYALINKRVSQIQAQLYLMRVEIENRHTRDPGRIYEDPLAISAYGERVETVTRITRVLDFTTEILAYGWYPLEYADGQARRWMRPGEVSVACLPHLGKVDQIVEIRGYVLTPEQFNQFEIRVGQTIAAIERVAGTSTAFVARLELQGEDLKSANYMPVEFRLGMFEQPNQSDTRLLGANIGQFTISPSGVEPIQTTVTEPTDIPDGQDNASGEGDPDSTPDTVAENAQKADT